MLLECLFVHQRHQRDIKPLLWAYPWGTLIHFEDEKLRTRQALPHLKSHRESLCLQHMVSRWPFPSDASSSLSFPTIECPSPQFSFSSSSLEKTLSAHVVQKINVKSARLSPILLLLYPHGVCVCARAWVTLQTCIPKADRPCPFLPS